MDDKCVCGSARMCLGASACHDDRFFFDVTASLRSSTRINEKSKSERKRVILLTVSLTDGGKPDRFSSSVF